MVAAPLLLACGCIGNIGDGPGAQGGSGLPSDPLDAVTCPSAGVTPLRRLGQAEYAHVVFDVLGVSFDASQLERDEKVGAFVSNSQTPVSVTSLYKYRDAAESVAASAVTDGDLLAGCESTDDDACLEAFVRETGRRLLRGPLDDAEVARYLAVAETGDGAPETYRLVLETMLQSPRFLYQLELAVPAEGDTVVPLAPYEMASRLSFFLWQSTPDDALLDAAEQGTLATVEGLREQAQRMLEDPRAQRALESFHVGWLGLDKLGAVEKDLDVYPHFDAELRAAMLEETRRFVNQVILSGDARLKTLLTSQESYLEGPLFALYGLEEPPGHDPSDPVELPAGQRAGLLTQASFLATHAHRDESGPVQRGVVVQTNLLCQPPLPPPNDVPDLPEGGPTDTMRELLQQQHQNADCAGCHKSIDGIGLGFEGYDGSGKWRPTQNGAPTDVSGELLGVDVAGPFQGAVELADKLADSADVRDCVAEQWFRFAFRRAIEEGDEACSLAPARELFAAQGGDIRALLLALVETDSFRHRAVQ
jgi:hypothetical protein